MDKGGEGVQNFDNFVDVIQVLVSPRRGRADVNTRSLFAQRRRNDGDRKKRMGGEERRECAVDYTITVPRVAVIVNALQYPPGQVRSDFLKFGHLSLKRAIFLTPS